MLSETSQGEFPNFDKDTLLCEIPRYFIQTYHLKDNLTTCKKTPMHLDKYLYIRISTLNMHLKTYKGYSLKSNIR